MIFRGMNVANPINRLKAGWVVIAQNVRQLIRGAFGMRNVLSGALVTLSAAVMTVERLNYNGGYALVSVDSSGNLYYNGSKIATGLSGNPVSIIPFRPNASPETWGYIGDSAADGSVTITTKYALNGDPATFACSGMLKVRASDGLCYKTGIKEPQLAPLVTTANTSVNVNGTLQAKAIPWTNYSGANSSYSYGETNGYPDPTPDGTAPFVINCQNATSITIASLNANPLPSYPFINGSTVTVPTAPGPSSAGATTPGHYTMKQDGSGTTPASANPSVVIGAFCDASGNVVSAGVAPLYIPAVVDVGASLGTAITVPYGAATFQVGINSTGNTFVSNSGSFTLSGTVTTNALPSVLSIFGNLTAYYWGDSPYQGPTASYIWKNPDDPYGSGPTRTTSNAVGSTSGNSFIFDANFGSACSPAQPAGIPGPPGIGNLNLSMQWFQINPQDVVTGSYPVFSPAIKGLDGNTAYQNFNFCLTGSIYFPASGNYTFVLTNECDVIWGIGGGVNVVSAVASGPGEGGIQKSGYGQTITVVNGYPLLPRQNYTQGNSEYYAISTVVVNVPAAGVYPVEIDYDEWYTDSSGRILLLLASPTPGAPVAIIPPLPIGVRENVVYWGKYRSSLTGAVSNPSPPSTAQVTPVLANQVASAYSTDPQVDKVDYYRQDSGLANPTYVATGPNDNGQGGGVNTAIADSLSDLAAASNPTMNYDDFEPFPSIDLPRSGTCNVSGGVITRLTGDYFNVRWLPGTIIEIGSPTQLAYSFIARPTSTTSVTVPGVPDGTNLVWNISQPSLAAQPLPYLFGPTDNYVTMHGVGDPNRPGVDYWTKGNNFDSAPDTNQADVTSPSETLVNGAISGGLGVLGSIARFWIIAPNQFDALETVTGTQGSTWTYRLTPIERGLFIPRCLAVSGGGTIFSRVEDGVHISKGGASKSITDEELYPLFPHEGSTPAAITMGGVTVYPPDDTKPQLQQMSVVGQYMYYDYQGIDGNRHTLVFDEESMGWMWDATSPSTTCHASNDGQSQQGVLAGCVDHTVRTMAPTGSETPTSVVLTSAIGGKGYQHALALTIEYSSNAAISVTPVVADEGNGSYVTSGFYIDLPSTGGVLAKYRALLAPNKWKLLQLKLQWSDPTALVYIEGLEIDVKDWGSAGGYRQVSPFSDAGGFGGEV